MNQNDDRLKALLGQWREIEPQANFEANVWRRIRLAKSETPETVGVIQLLLRNWLRKPAMSVTAAAVASLVIGASVGVMTVPQSPGRAPRELGFLEAGTLTGGYLRTAAEGAR